jgi:hypothetical protein
MKYSAFEGPPVVYVTAHRGVFFSWVDRDLSFEPLVVSLRTPHATPVAKASKEFIGGVNVVLTSIELYRVP